MNSGTVETSERQSEKEEYETIKGTSNVAFRFLLHGLTAPQKTDADDFKINTI